MEEGTISVNALQIVQRQPSQEISVVSSPWANAKWIDLIGFLPKGKSGASFAIVVIDYFIKWIEAKPLAKLLKQILPIFYGKISYASLESPIQLIRIMGDNLITLGSKAYVRS